MEANVILISQDSNIGEHVMLPKEATLMELTRWHNGMETNLKQSMETQMQMMSVVKKLKNQIVKIDLKISHMENRIDSLQPKTTKYH